MPKEFPYFHVEIGERIGFAHVIEDARDFPHYFGKEVCMMREFFIFRTFINCILRMRKVDLCTQQVYNTA